jgi:hypothetical protein
LQNGIYLPLVFAFTVTGNEQLFDLLLEKESSGGLQSAGSSYNLTAAAAAASSSSSASFSIQQQQQWGSRKLRLMEDQSRGVVCQNLQEVQVQSVSDVLQLLRRGLQQQQLLQRGSLGGNGASFSQGAGAGGEPGTLSSRSNHSFGGSTGGVSTGAGAGGAPLSLSATYPGNPSSSSGAVGGGSGGGGGSGSSGPGVRSSHSVFSLRVVVSQKATAASSAVGVGGGGGGVLEDLVSMGQLNFIDLAG